MSGATPAVGMTHLNRHRLSNNNNNSSSSSSRLAPEPVHNTKQRRILYRSGHPFLIKPSVTSHASRQTHAAPSPHLVIQLLINLCFLRALVITTNLKREICTVPASAPP